MPTKVEILWVSPHCKQHADSLSSTCLHHLPPGSMVVHSPSLRVCTILHTHLSLCHLPPSIYPSIKRTTSPSIYLPMHMLSTCLLTSYIPIYLSIHRINHIYLQIHGPPTYNQSPTYPSTKSPIGPPIYISTYLSTGLPSYIPTYLAIGNPSIYLPIYP